MYKYGDPFADVTPPFTQPSSKIYSSATPVLSKLHLGFLNLLNSTELFPLSTLSAFRRCPGTFTPVETCGFPVVLSGDTL
jgi:hypothetical protein